MIRHSDSLVAPSFSLFTRPSYPHAMVRARDLPLLNRKA
jgi:hypothetical protein